MVYQIIQWWATIFLRLYFRRTIVYGLEHLPSNGPLIVASNHPSAFMEASILGTVIKRPLHFLVRGDMFNPKFQFIFNWTNQIPIFRQKDGISNLRKNASSFEFTYKKLATGEAVLIFPEAKTTLEKKMRPIQRGTAHLAFGTLPYLKEGEQLNVLPVGVNFTDPRMPGTDVVVRFGPAFVTEKATREDREAIDRFTSKLSSSLHPLIIEVEEGANEPDYDVLASVYWRMGLLRKKGNGVHEDLGTIAKAINKSEILPGILGLIRSYRAGLNKQGLGEAIYFPDLFLKNRIVLFFLMILKACWLLSGGWVWRLTRKVIFSKIRKNTFQSPVTVGAAMVLFPAITILFACVCLIAGWPLWIVFIWMLVMILGMFFRTPFHLMIRVFVLNSKIKKELTKNVKGFKTEITRILK